MARSVTRSRPTCTPCVAMSNCWLHRGATACTYSRRCSYKNTTAEEGMPMAARRAHEAMSGQSDPAGIRQETCCCYLSSSTRVTKTGSDEPKKICSGCSIDGGSHEPTESASKTGRLHTSPGQHFVNVQDASLPAQPPFLPRTSSNEVGPDRIVFESSVF